LYGDGQQSSALVACALVATYKIAQMFVGIIKENKK
jgi:hypothetical protein